VAGDLAVSDDQTLHAWVVCSEQPRDHGFGDWFVRPLIGSRRVAEGQMALLRNLDFGLIDGLDAVHARIGAPV
jgi:hypothetical protein